MPGSGASRRGAGLAGGEEASAPSHRSFLGDEEPRVLCWLQSVSYWDGVFFVLHCSLAKNGFLGNSVFLKYLGHLGYSCSCPSWSVEPAPNIRRLNASDSLEVGCQRQTKHGVKALLSPVNQSSELFF